MTRHLVLLASLLAVAVAQSTYAYDTTQQQSQQINLDPNSGPLKLRIVFQADQNQQTQQSPCSTGNCQSAATLSPCSSGNCGSVQQVQQASPCSTGNCGQQTVQQSPCSTGNCNGAVAGSANIVPAYDASTLTTTTQSPVTIRTAPISSNSVPVKVIRIPSYSNSGCFSPPCGPRFVYAQPPCSGNSCGFPRFFHPRRRHHFFGQRPIFIGNNRNNGGGNVAIPDTIYRDGMAIRAPIRVPSSYQDGNPVFNSGK
ncbi:unnamed protein product [Caenorhabditis sp. 36 PRJEB53466]|nr:unnamed protein product [Caenorhabditis sp. 36 PRJEB53466]